MLANQMVPALTFAVAFAVTMSGFLAVLGWLKQRRARRAGWSQEQLATKEGVASGVPRHKRTTAAS